LKDGSIAALTIARVWITRDGYAKLLDFRAPGVQPAAHQEEPATLESGQAFLGSVAGSALARWSGDESGATAAAAREPLPLSASAMLETLARRGFTTWSEMVTRTAALLQGPDRVRRGRRAVPLVLCGVMPTMMALMFLVITPLMSRMMTSDVMALNNALVYLSYISQRAGVDSTRDRAALEVYIAGRFRSMITDPQTWVRPTAAILLRQRALAERVVADHPNVSADEMAAATAALGPFLRAQERDRGNTASVKWWTVALMMFAVNFTFIALFGVVWAFVLRGGLLFGGCGIAVVTGDGKPASRLRALWRGVLAWALVPAAFWLGVRVGVGVGVGVGMLFLAGAAWALAHPTRGLQDGIAGTWLVPR
jgi:hypothetical protein